MGYSVLTATRRVSSQAANQQMMRHMKNPVTAIALPLGGGCCETVVIVKTAIKTAHKIEMPYFPRLPSGFVACL